MLNEVPYRGSGTPMPPTDPLIYRFYEMVMVNGPAWKALIEEEFGDGIMSAIDFNVEFEREPTRRATASRSRMSGKFLPQFPNRCHPAHIGEGPLVLHLAGTLQESRERVARHRAADADALDAGFRQLRDGQGRVGITHHQIERFFQRRNHRLDGGEIVEAGRIQHVGAGGLERLQPADGVVEVVAAVQKRFSALAVSVNGNGSARAASTAACSRSTASAKS